MIVISNTIVINFKPSIKDLNYLLIYKYLNQITYNVIKNNFMQAKCLTIKKR
jgi:hypothetical protein